MVDVWFMMGKLLHLGSSLPCPFCLCAFIDAILSYSILFFYKGEEIN